MIIKSKNVKNPPNKNVGNYIANENQATIKNTKANKQKHLKYNMTTININMYKTTHTKSHQIRGPSRKYITSKILHYYPLKGC